MVDTLITLPLPVGRNGSINLSDFNWEEYSILLFKDILQDVDIICSQFGKKIYNRIFIISIYDKYSFNFTPKKKEDLSKLFGNNLLTSSVFLQSFDGKFSAYNSPKDEYSIFFVKKTEELNASFHLLFERFREMVRNGTIGFPDASIPYFNDLLSPAGMSI